MFYTVGQYILGALARIYCIIKPQFCVLNPLVGFRPTVLLFSSTETGCAQVHGMAGTKTHTTRLEWHAWSFCVR